MVTIPTAPWLFAVWRRGSRLDAPGVRLWCRPFHFTDSFAGIAPRSVPGFVLAQLAATLAAYPLLGWLFANDDSRQVQLP